MSEKRKQRPPMRIQNVFIFLLLAIFAVCAILLTAMSARVYRSTVEASHRNNAVRTAAAIIRGAAQGEDAGIASVREEGGIPVLVFRNDYDGEIYDHRLYCAGGYLRESLTGAETPFEEEMGEPLVEMTRFEPRIQGNTLEALIETPEGDTETVAVWLWAGGAKE